MLSERPVYDNSDPIGTTIADIITEGVFLLGYDDVWDDVEFDTAKIATNKGCRWAYERGRQFATLQRVHGPFRKLKMQGEALNKAVSLWTQWRSRGWII